MELARQLAALKVDVIEAGFPVSSPAQFEAVQRIADELEVIIAGLARTKEIDIKAAYDALRNTKHPRIHTFLCGPRQHGTRQLDVKSQTTPRGMTLSVEPA